MKAVRFVADSLDRLREFPESARHDAGYQLNRVQCGLAPDDWKPMPDVGAGVMELRIRDVAGISRVIYVAKFEEAIYVLHCFQKKTQKTAQTDLRLARSRLKEVIRSR